MAKNKNNQAIWNTRIKKNASSLFQKVGNSIDIDKRLYKEDIQGSIAHVEMLFKEKIISFKKILDLFFKMHDPTQKDMQFPDVGTQYRSEIFYEDDIQKAEAKEILETFNKELNGKIQTNISQLKNYCKAEEYHQKYLEKNR